MKTKNYSGIVGVVSFILWLITFLPGLTINSQPYRDAILLGDISFESILMVLLAYTITNVAILCALSGIIGAAAKTLLEKSDSSSKNDVWSNPISSGVVRGFFVYLLFLAGVYAATPDPFGTTTPGQYVRMAGTVSVLSFIVNYEPNLFKSIIGFAESRIPGTGKEKKSD